MASRKLEVEIVGDSRSLERAFGKARGSTSSFGKTFGATGAGVAAAGKMAAVGIAAVAGGGAILGKKLIGLASDAEEVDSKFKVVFGKNVPALEQEIRKFSEATGASRFEMKKQAADMGALLEPLSANKKEAGDLSLKMVKLASDLGSFNNVPVADALLALRSGLVGEAEPLRRFGVLLNEAAVNAEGLRLGLIKKGETLTEQEKVQARASLIMQQTTLAQGDATRTADSMANQMKRLKNELTDTATEMGQALLPTALRMVTWFNANWPTIERVGRQVFAALGQAWRSVLKPALEAVIGAFADVARYARENWDRVQEAAARAMAYYRGTLQPTIQQVMRFLGALWDRFGDEVQTAIGVVVRVIGNGLRAAKAVIEGVMAVIRGDWSQAWESLKRVVSLAVDSVKTILSGFVSIAAGLLREAGAAMIRGLIGGITSMAGAAKDAAVGVVKGAKDAVVGFLDIRSPSRLFYKIGTDIMQGWSDGVLAGKLKLAQALVRSAQAAVDAAQSRVQGVFGRLSGMAQFVFGRKQASAMTPTEKRLAALEEQRAGAGREQAVSDAAAELDRARGIEDPEERASAVRRAEQALADAKFEVLRAGLEKQAEAERRALEERQYLEQEAFNRRLDSLQRQLEAGHLTAEQARKKMRDLLDDFGLDASAAGVHATAAFVRGMLALVPAVGKAAAVLRKAAQGQGALEGNIASIERELERREQAEKKDKGKVVPMAEGGLVRGGRGGVLALIGEGRHDELVLPLRKGAAGLGEVHLHVHLPGHVAVGTPDAIVQALLPAIRVELDKVKRANVSTGL